MEHGDASSGMEITVLYDGDCPFCRAQMARLRRLDRVGALELLPLQDPRVAERFPALERAALLREMHVIDRHGRVHRGGDGVVLLLRQVAPWRMLRFIAGLAPIRLLIRTGYPWVAARRRRDGPCTDEVCAVHTQASPNSDLTPAGRRAAGLFSAGLLLALLAPVVQNWRADPVDGFPLSYYPMFSYERGETYRFYHAVGMTHSGERVAISYRRMGTGGFNAVRRQLARIARSDDPDLIQRYTEGIAARVASAGRRSEAEIVEVRLVRATYAIGPYFLERDKAPVRETLVASAAVPGRLNTSASNLPTEQDRHEDI